MTVKEIREKIQRKLRRKYHWHTWNQLWRSNSPSRSYRLEKDTKREGFAYTDGKYIKCNVTEEIEFTFYPKYYGARQAIVQVLLRKEYRKFDGSLVDVEYITNELTFEEFKLVFCAINNILNEDLIRKEK